MLYAIAHKCIYVITLAIQAGLVLSQEYFPEKRCANQTQNPHLKQRISWGLAD